MEAATLNNRGRGNQNHISSPLWPISEQRGEMNPIPATKTIKRLYYYSVTVFDLYLSIIARCNSFLSLTFAMS